MSLWLVCSLIPLLLHSSQGAATAYVRPNNTVSCPGDVCENLDYYASRNTLQGSNSTLIFLPGSHTLTLVLTVSNSSYLTITVMDSTKPTIITCKQPAGFIFQNIQYMNMNGLTFQFCGTEYRSDYASALKFENIVNLYLQDLHVKNSSGYGLLAKNIFGFSTITQSTFTFNHGSSCGGNILIKYSECIAIQYPSFLDISHSIASFGSFKNCMDNVTVATGITLILSCSEIRIRLFNVTLLNNSNSLIKGVGGNLFVHFLNKTGFTSNQVIVQECILCGGSSWVGGGIAFAMYTEQNHTGSLNACNNTLVISDSIILANSAVTGAGMFIEVVSLTTNSPCPRTDIVINNTTFDGNVAVSQVNHGGGIAIHILNGYTRDFLFGVTALKIFILNSTIKRSQVKKQRDTNVAALFAMKFLGDLVLSNTTIVNNDVSGISLIKSKITFKDQNIISNNKGVNGGGLKMCESSYIILWYNATIFFTNNHAVQYGGAVYVEEPCSSHPTCFYQFPYDAECDTQPLADVAHCYGSQVVMTGNTASHGGEDIFGGSVDTCHLHKTHHYVDCDIFYSIFNVSRNVLHHYSAVSSKPVKVCGCSEHSGFKYDCIERELNSTAYPGQTISIPIVLVGQLEGTVPGVLTVNNDDVYNVSSTSSCTTLHVTVRLWPTSQPKLTLRLEVLNEESFIINRKEFTEGNPYSINVHFKNCPIGFTLNSVGACDCLNQIRSSFKCDINTLRIIPTGHGWIGYTSIRGKGNEAGVIFHMFCPFDFCINDVNISLHSSATSLDSDVQCSSHRSGLLCGACSSNYSMVMGSTKCLDCRKQSNLYLLLIICLQVLMHLLITFLLFFFNISTTDGTLSGLLFYANIVFSMRPLFNCTKVHLLSIPIAWLNLDAGMSYCLYDGMDTYVKVLLEFLYPPLIWCIVGAVIVIGKKYSRIASLLGNRPITVLATLLELSYYRTIQACIKGLSFTVIEVPSYNNGTILKYVWLCDANVDYLRGKHCLLFIIAALYSLVVLAYTTVLLFVQPLQRYSHVYCCGWVNRLKPLIDAYTAPGIIKPQCRCWVGLLLLFRVILAIVFSINYIDKPQYNLAAIITACVLVCTIAAIAGGIYHSVARNILNISSIINLTFISFGTELLRHDRRTSGSIFHTILTCSSVGFALITMVILASFYIYRRFRSIFKHTQNVHEEPLLGMNDGNFIHSRNHINE